MSRRFYVSEASVREDKDWMFDTLAQATAKAKELVIGDGRPRGVCQVVYRVERTYPIVVTKVSK